MSTAKSNASLQIKASEWGAFELCLLFSGLWLVSAFFHRATGATWTGPYPYTGATLLVLCASLPVALAAPTSGGKTIRMGVPLLFVYLFYSAAHDGNGLFERLQHRLELPHFLLVFGSSFMATLLTAQAAEKEKARIKEEATAELQKKKAVVAQIPPETRSFDRIVGQNHVIAPLKEIANIARSGIRVGKPNAPHAVLLFLGPTGVGKTEAAIALAEAVYSSKEALIRFDMGQFTDSHQANRFYGPPPGYVGSEEGGQLTRAVLKKPRSVVLLDEMEKAHSQIWDAFLPVFDEGYIVDGSTNQRVDMTNTIIVLTSNLLAGQTDAHLLEPYEIKDRVLASGALRPELVGRINEILVFKPLDSAAITEILKRRLDAALWSLSSQGIPLTVNESDFNGLVAQVQAAKFGVRQIDDVVRTYLRKAIAERRGATPGLD